MDPQLIERVACGTATEKDAQALEAWSSLHSEPTALKAIQLILDEGPAIQDLLSRGLRLSAAQALVADLGAIDFVDEERTAC